MLPTFFQRSSSSTTQYHCSYHYSIISSGLVHVLLSLVKEVCCAQSLMKLANKKGNEVGPEVVEEIESEQVNVVSNTKLKVR